MTLRLRFLACLFLVVFGVAPVSAQEAERRVRLDIERFRPAPDGIAGFAVSDPRGLTLGQFALSLNLNNAFVPLALQRDDGTRVDLVSNRLGGALSGLVGLHEFVAVGLDIPFLAYQSGSLLALPPGTRPTSTGELGAVAMGDLRITPRLALLNQKSHGVDLAFDVSLTLPTGNEEALFGDRGVGGTGLVTVGGNLQALRLIGQLGGRFRPSGEAVRASVGSELMLRGAAIYNLELGQEAYLPRQLIGEVDVGTMFSDFLDGATSPGEWRVGARFCPMPNLALTAGGGGGLTRAYGTPFARATVAVSWDPRACPVADADGDGVPDADDKCPTVVGVIEEQGCPAPVDSDGDGIADPEDRCPAEPGVAEFEGCPPPPPPDTDGDGFIDAEDKCPEVAGIAEFEGCPPPPDTDGDGIIDEQDKCPEEAGVAEFEGCPIPDRDGDGVYDSADQCPDEAGPAERAGCPIRDADGDGIEDFQDRCPNEAGPAERFGCPVKDTDGDGVPDDEDNCPREAGSKQNHGCKLKQIVVIRREKIEILEKVNFATNSAVISKSSFKLLDQVASVIKEHPELPRIQVEGHTDNVGDAEKNKTLSQARADSVRTYLVGKGIDPAKLVAVGFGEDQPIAPNLTKRGRDANRRVEFRIIEAEKPAQEAPAPVSEPVVAPAHASEPVVAPAPVSEPVVAPAPVSEPEVAPAPVKEPAVAPAPVSEPVVAPAPVSEPVVAPAPVSEPVVAPAPVSEPVVVPEPATEAVEAPAPSTAPVSEPEPAPVSEPESSEASAGEPEPLPVVAPATEEPAPALEENFDMGFDELPLLDLPPLPED